MPGISIHVVDVSRGLVAAGMRVELFRGGELVAGGSTSPNGLLERPELEAGMPAGAYEAVFHVAAYYSKEGIALPEVPFLDRVHYHFGVSDPQQHYHLPFKCTPWGYSCFRGGA